MKAWLLALMSKNFTTRMVRCEFAHHIWSRLNMFCTAQVRAKIMQLKNRLGTIKKTSSIGLYGQ
ncbi:hypothetical protein AHAS_Ahas11G0095700 [Arachis hypogaea]